MDKRLNQIQTGTLTESRLNDDFVYWLKTKGLNYLLVVLLIGCGVMGYQWYQRVQNQRRGEAWARLEAAGTPQDLVEVVSEHGSIGSLAIIARVRAADTYVGSVIRGVRYDRDPTSPEAAVTPELRTQWFDEADRHFMHARPLYGDRLPAAVWFHWAALAVVVSATSYAVYQILTRRMAGVDSPETSALYSWR